MGVEAQQQLAGKDGVVNVEQLNLWCADGMRSVKLADVQRVRFLNPFMDNEARKALETLSLSHGARILDVEPNEERLLSYAVGLGYAAIDFFSPHCAQRGGAS